MPNKHKSNVAFLRARDTVGADCPFLALLAVLEDAMIVYDLETLESIYGNCVKSLYGVLSNRCVVYYLQTNELYRPVSK